MPLGTIQSINSPIKFMVLEDNSSTVHPAHVSELEGIDQLPDDEAGRAELIGRRVRVDPRSPSTNVKSVSRIEWIN